VFATRVSGLREVDAVLAKLGPALASGAMETALILAAEPTVEAAKALAPFDPDRKRKKHLRDTIKAYTKLRKSQRRSLSLTTSRAFAQVFVGPSASHAHLIEFGHAIVARGPDRDRAGEKAARKAARAAGKKYRSPKGGRGGPVIGHVPAHPFLRPAWDSTRQQVLDRFTKNVREVIYATARGARVAAAAGNLDARAAASLNAAE
jgi:HK97 gp10 family phage protein